MSDIERPYGLLAEVLLPGSETQGERTLIGISQPATTNRLAQSPTTRDSDAIRLIGRDHRRVRRECTHGQSRRASGPDGAFTAANSYKLDVSGANLSTYVGAVSGAPISLT